MIENEISHKIIGLAIDVHKALGPGLLESAYKECLFYEIKLSGIVVIKEKPMPLIYKEVTMDCGYRIDLVIMDKLVVEVKSVECINEIHIAQTLTYIKLGGFKLGLLINFNTILLKDGIKRLINTFS
jgi:GxxExxY protein